MKTGKTPERTRLTRLGKMRTAWEDRGETGKRERGHLKKAVLYWESIFGTLWAAVCGVSRRATIEQTSDTADRS